jgi:hypothetical protein
VFGFFYANPLRLPEQYDFLNVAGILSPGVFVLSGGSRPYKWDIKDAAGTQGATETYRGLRPSDDVKGKFLFWTADQIDEFFTKFVPLLHYDATKSSPKPIDVLHPVLAANGITTLVTTNVGPLTHEGQQLWSVTVEFTEFKPAKKKNATTTPNSTKTTTNTAGKPTAQDAQDKEIEKLLELAKKPI